MLPRVNGKQMMQKMSQAAGTVKKGAAPLLQKAVKTAATYIPTQKSMNDTAKNVAKTVTVETAGMRHGIVAAAAAAYEVGKELVEHATEGVKEGLAKETKHMQGGDAEAEVVG